MIFWVRFSWSADLEKDTVEVRYASLSSKIFHGFSDKKSHYPIIFRCGFVFFFWKPWPPRICLVQFDQIVPALDDAAVVFTGYPRPTTHSGETYYDGRRYDGQMNHIFLMPVYRGSVERLSIYFGRPAVDFAYR